MGDILRLTTFPQEQQIIYKVPTDGLKFSVRGRNNAAIGILSAPNFKCVGFWVIIGQRNQTWIKSSLGQGKTAHTPNILSPDEFKSFWIIWTSLGVSIGREGEEEPIVTCPGKNPSNLNYVTFFVSPEGSGPLEWIFELAPEIPRPVERHIDGGKVEWVRCGNQVPWNAVIGGYENETLYIIRAHHPAGSLAVGKFVPSRGVGYIAWGSLAHQKEGPELEFLVGYDCHWVQASGSQIPVGAIVGGYTEHHQRENIYVGRGRCKDHLIPGKVHKKYEMCYTPFEGREMGHRNYEILISSEVNQRSVNRRFLDHMTIDAPDGSDVEESDEDPYDEYDEYEENIA